MKKIIIVAVLLGTMTLAACAAKRPADGGSVTVVSWGGAYADTQRKAFFKPYMAATGNDVVEKEYDGSLDQLAAMAQAKKVTWDVIDVDAATAIQGCDDGLFERLDMIRIGDPAKFLPGSVMDCAVGTVAYSTIFAFDDGKFTGNHPTTLADFFDVQKYPGKRGLLKNAAGNLEWALLADGMQPSDIYKTLATPEGVDRAFKKLDTIKPEIVWWESGAQPIDLLGSGRVVMTSAWHARINNAIKNGKNFKIVWDFQELDWDFWAIVKGAPNLGRAYDFVKFASDPKVMSQHSKYIDYGPTRMDAAALVDPDIAGTIPTHPDNMATAFPIDPQFWARNSDALNRRFDAWLAQ
ncbi:extracellular solute-binding protein [Dongia sp.]|uniref:ABC transporter substrate-binding protein n=1 Tax=Dongia sp. TaxID=1977262 RepID=UPI0035B2429A